MDKNFYYETLIRKTPMHASLLSKNTLYRIAHETLKELETEQGILASAKNELYGCLFGRDSLISALGLLKAYSATREQSFLELSQKIVRNLCALQGTEVNIESGEEPGKIIHEYRPTDHDRLTKRSRLPWFVYPDGSLKSYDTVDATSLFLIAAFRIHQVSNDSSFAADILPSVYKALNWILIYGDSNGDGFIDYQFHPKRSFGGLRTQGWMDSSEALFHDDGSTPVYPIAPVEVQAYTYLALRLWAGFFVSSDREMTHSLHKRATDLKYVFNEKFIASTPSGTVLASALDGASQHVSAVRSSMGHCLWSSLTDILDGVQDSILDTKHISPIVQRLLADDMFVPQAGIRTLSSLSPMYNAHGYHNGTIWPHDTSMIAEGFDNVGYHLEAELVRHALLKSYEHFKAPIELFSYTTDYAVYTGSSGQKACLKQAWSAASLLKELSHQKANSNTHANPSEFRKTERVQV